jgi:hypothetical protein
MRAQALTGDAPVITFETVPTDTPAISATFLMLGISCQGWHSSSGLDQNAT